MRFAVAGGTGTVGSHVVHLAEQAGHEVVVLTRSRGVDLLTGEGLNLVGIDAVIDTLGPRRTKSQPVDFFGETTTQLLRAEQRDGVTHHVALSIVGAVNAPYGYYAGKALQEQLVSESPLPWTILRATQFFEFAEHNVKSLGRLVFVPTMLSRPLSAASVAAALVRHAEGEAAGMLPDLAGPEVMRIKDVARAIHRVRGDSRLVIEVPLGGRFGKALRNGAILPSANAEIVGPALQEWLALVVP